MALFLILIVPIIAAFLSCLIRKNLRLFGAVAVSASLLELVAVFLMVMPVLNNGFYKLNGHFSVDALGLILAGLLAIVGVAASWYSTGYLKIEVEKKIIGFGRVRQYFILLHLFILAMFFAIVTTSPIFMWIAIEATTLSTAFLVSFYGKPTNIEAAWKYLIINSVGLLLGFFGTLLFLSPAIRGGFDGLISWDTLLSNIFVSDPFIIKIAFIFTLIGFGTKVGFVPMHTWRPDAYSKAPIPIVALLSGALLNVALASVLRFKSVADLSVGKEFSSNLLIFFGIISIVIAAFNILGQKNYKRLLAYSSIEHAGIMALGFGFGGVGVFAAILHMIYHSLTKSILFLSAGNIFLKFGSTKIKNVNGLLATLPITGVLFIIGFLAITGVPPFGIFITEFLILSSGIKAHPFVVFSAIIALTLVFIGFLRRISLMTFGEKVASIASGEGGIWTIAPIIFLMIILFVLSFCMPSPIRALLQMATIKY